MPVCSLCPGRSFKDDNAIRMHRESGKHAGYSCGKCSNVLRSQQGLEQHTRDKHPSFECRHCDREFTTVNGRDAHEEAKHPTTFECHYCHREFNSEEGRQQHENAKHPTTFECHYCHRGFNSEEGRQQHENVKHPTTFECHYCHREFNSEEARQQHENAKHIAFECRYCDRKFSSDDAREQHEDDKHSAIECRYCDRKFSSDDAREQHEDDKHSAIECRYCDREFSSGEARQQHEDAKHHFKCNLCGKNFTQVAALQQHEQTTPHFGCSYCMTKIFTTAIKKAHEVSCGGNPANRVTRPALTLSSQSGLSSSNHPKLTEIVEEELSPSAVTDEGSEPSTSPSRSSQDGGEMFHSTSALPSTDANGEGATATQPCACTHSLGPGTCSICQPSNTNTPVPDDAESVVSADENRQDDSRDHRDVMLQCTPCLEIFETEASFRDHVCAFRTATFRPHCPVCYTQFDDGPSLQEHLEGLQAFSCQLCLTRCCSDEMLQDHLLSHPTCSKCGKSFADNLALCAHVESDHPVVVCWDCDGIVVDKNSLELHYADSSEHPSCTFCGVGKRNSVDMDEHVRYVHATSAEIEDQPGAGNVNPSPDEESPLAETQPPGADREDVTRQPLEELDRAPLPSGVETGGPLGGPGDELHSTPLQTESSLSSSPQPPMPPQVEHVDETAGNPSVINGEEPPDVGLRQDASPTPTPSEHGRDASRQLLASKVTNTATNNDTRPSTPVSSVSAVSLSDPSTRSSPTSSSSGNSVVFVSADGIPDYIRENRAILVATSTGSPSSGRMPLQLSSESSPESLDMAGPHTREARVSTEDDATTPKTGGSVTHRLHCRICLRDPCEDMTATICGHLFCKRCITQAVVAKSECPICESAALLYCLFKLDLSV